ncbi:hypothetical protein BGZ74_004653 [Mortierella antarctica]|nr:hypothetical protein BGZ74_004653 [Mortierella antarctica]
MTTTTTGIKKSKSRSVGLCFFVQGPRSRREDLDTNKLMHDYPVMIHQHDYHCEVYGQPQDVAEAIMQGFFWPKEHDQECSDGQEDKECDREGDTGAPNSALGDPGALKNAHGDSGQTWKSAHGDPGKTRNKTQTQPMRPNQHSLEHLNSMALEASPVLDVTDYELCKGQMERNGPHSHMQPERQGVSSEELSDPEKSQDNSNNDNSLAQDPYAIMLSIPSCIYQYLVYETGGLQSKQPNLHDSVLKGFLMDMLAQATAGAGLVMVFNMTWTLPKLTDLVVTLECDNLEQLLQMLSRIATTFMNPLVNNKILESLSPSNRMH